jgi:Helix-loop-helix DNA-binding domain
MQNMYSSTPDGPPIQSPFLGNFDYNQFKPFNSIPQHMSPHQGSLHHKRPSIQAMNRKSSDQRSPMTPKTAAMAGLQIGTPESGSYPNGRPIRTPSLQNRHAKTLSGHYDSTPGSIQSFLESPVPSPGHPAHHTGIGETLGSSKHSSLPIKSELDNQNQSAESVEAKKRRRRASHNAVERRRRDNINERIQDLSHLVPQHRLDDDKVKKQLQNNTPMSPSLGAVSMSPPNAANAATSLLAGASGRRAASTAGNITIGLPVDEKEKGPNKGDILNGSVSFMRDLMWALYQKYMQEDDLAERFAQLGGVWPYERSEDEKRMRSELMEAMEQNDPNTFNYSRSHGSGLRVPGHTNLTGDPMQGNSNMSPQSMLELSPGFHSGGSGTNSGSGGAGQPQFWNSAGHPGISFKEEDEFMNDDI